MSFPNNEGAAAIGLVNDSSLEICKYVSLSHK